MSHAKEQWLKGNHELSKALAEQAKFTYREIKYANHINKLQQIKDLIYNAVKGNIK